MKEEMKDIRFPPKKPNGDGAIKNKEQFPGIKRF